MKVLTIIGKKWFDRVNGNTYHSATIYADDKVFNVPFQYGYGDQYVQSAVDVLEEKGLIKLHKYSNGNKEALWTYCEERGIKLNYAANYLSKKKDVQ